MFKFILVLLFWSTIAQSEVKIKELSTEYRNSTCDFCIHRHSFLDKDIRPKYSIIHNTEVSIYDYLLFKNRFFFDGVEKVEYAGLEYHLGLDIPIGKTSSFEIGKFHHSSHALDKTIREGSFPLQDSIYIKINWIDNEK